MTIEVKEAIERAEHVLAFGRVSNSLKDIRDDFIKVNKVEEIIKYIDSYKDILLLASGDPCFYGIVEFIKKKEIPIKNILPGLSSFQYMMAKLGKSWGYASFLSLHGRDEELEKVKDSRLTIILTDKHSTPSIISKKLAKLEVEGTIYTGFNLSYEDEKIIKVNIGDEIEDISSLSVVVIEHEMD